MKTTEQIYKQHMESMRAWSMTSATQTSAFQRCNRYWYLGWVLRIPRSSSWGPTIGSAIHNNLEKHLRGEIIPEDYTEALTLEKTDILTGEVSSEIRNIKIGPYIRVIAPYFSEPNDPNMVSEWKFFLPVIEGVQAIGFVDFGWSPPEQQFTMIKDLKSSSNFRWCKTPRELETDIQLNLYAEATWHHGYDQDKLLASHVYVKTTAKRTNKNPQTKEVEVELFRENTRHIFEGVQRQTRTMKVIADSKCHPDEVEPNSGACGDFGGCPFRKICNVSPLSRISFAKPSTPTTTGGTLPNTDKGNPMASFAEKMAKLKALKAQKNGGEDAPKGVTSGQTAQTAGQSAEPAPEAAAPAKQESKGRPGAAEGVVPPDAPSRETPVKTEEEKAAEAEAKKPAKKSTRKKSTKKKASGFTLYIDCVPAKGGDVEPTLYEDWVGPVTEKLNALVEEEHGLPDWRMVPYTASGMFAATINEACKKDLPPAMVIDSSTAGASIALEKLVNAADVVVRGVK